jgi:hypothetical protein
VEVVVVALEPASRDAQPSSEGVQLVEAGVADHVAPARPRQVGVRVLAQRIDEDGHSGMMAHSPC